jgi:hypothetical protein
VISVASPLLFYERAHAFSLLPSVRPLGPKIQALSAPFILLVKYIVVLIFRSLRLVTRARGSVVD